MSLAQAFIVNKQYFCDKISTELPTFVCIQLHSHINRKANGMRITHKEYKLTIPSLTSFVTYLGRLTLSMFLQLLFA